MRALKDTKKPKYTMRQNICYMINMAWKYQKSVLWISMLLAALKLCLNLAQLYVAPKILEKVEQSAPLTQLLGTIVLFAGLLFLLTTLCDYVNENTSVGRIYVRQQIVADISRKASTTSYPNTADPKVIKLLEGAGEATKSNHVGCEHIWTTLTNLLTDVGGFLVYLVLLSGLNGFLAAVVIVTTVAGFFVSKRINEWEYRHKEEKHQYWTQMNYILKKAESVELAKDIRMFGLGQWLRDMYGSVLRLFEAFVCKREKTYLWANVVDVVLSVARNAIAYIYLINLTLNEGLSASEFLLYFTAVSGFTAWITGILSECSTMHKECLEIGTVQEYLQYPEPFRFEGGKPIPEAAAYELRLENVTFRYPGTEENLFEDLSLTIHPGEKLAVVGLNGAGKTTLVKLLCGFYDPDEGRVLLNGIDIRAFNRQEYYQLLSAVFQEFSVMDMTVAENVAQQAEHMDIARVNDCLEKAGLTELVRQLPQGLNTHVGRDVYLDGVLFSGGQTQRLMLARALYKDGPILVLDEPTAALDPIAENNIYQKYNEMTAGKTSLFISHRLASTRFCDRIIFLANGKIAEEGTHEQLLKQNGAYAKLFEVQSRYYQEGRNFRGEE